eukprot:942379-Prymnesium_polylepis.1
MNSTASERRACSAVHFCSCSSSIAKTRSASVAPMGSSKPTACSECSSTMTPLPRFIPSKPRLTSVLRQPAHGAYVTACALHRTSSNKFRSNGNCTPAVALAGSARC